MYRHDIFKLVYQIVDVSRLHPREVNHQKLYTSSKNSENY